MNRLATIRVLVLGLLCLTGIAQAGESLLVSDAWMREMPPVVPNAALYMTVQNSGDSVQHLRAVEADWAQTLEIHESRQVDGMWQMQQLDQLAIEPGETLVLGPGGIHIMVFGVQRMPRAGERVSVRLLSDDAQPLEVEVVVRSGTDAGNSHHQHH